MGYSDTYATNTARIYSDLARSQAEAKLQSGAGWANALGQIGQIAGNLPGQIQDAKRAKQQEQYTAAELELVKGNLARAAKQDQESKWLDDAAQMATGQDGTVDTNKLSQILTQMGAAHVVPQAVETYQKMERGNLELQHARSQGIADQVQLEGLFDGVIGPAAVEIQKHLYDPAGIEAALGKLTRMGMGDQVTQFRTSVMTDPAKLKAAIDEYATRYRAIPKNVALASGAQLRNEVTGELIAENAKPEVEKTLSLDQELAEASRRGDGATVSRIMNLKAREAAAGRGPQAPKDERIVQVMSPEGKPVWTRESDAVGKPAAQAARAVTGAERQALAFYNRAKDAAENIAPLEEKVASMGLAGQTAMQVLPNFLQSQDAQLYRQAQRSFTEARLRKESGAAINPSEYENDSKTYFAQPGDSKKTLQQKHDARQKVLEGLAYSSGKAFDEFYGESMKDSLMGGKGGATADPLGIRKGGG